MLQKLTAGLGLLILLATPALAQVPADTVPGDTVPRENRTPRTAFLKSLLVPGWGHFSIGSETRGVFYVALEGSSWYMLLKTLGKLADVKAAESGSIQAAKDSLNDLMAADSVERARLSDPVVYETAVAIDPDVARLSPLVRSRKQQRQDWITYTVFFTFISAVDAYVTAHLTDFPGDITVAPTTGGGISLRLELPIPGPRRR